MVKKGELSILLAVPQPPELLEASWHHGRGSWLHSYSGIQAEVQDEENPWEQLEQSRARARSDLLMGLKRQVSRSRPSGLFLCVCALCGGCVLCFYVYTAEQLEVISCI